MMFYLNFQDNNDDVLAHVTKPTLVITSVRILLFTKQYKDTLLFLVLGNTGTFSVFTNFLIDQLTMYVKECSVDLVLAGNVKNKCCLAVAYCSLWNVQVTRLVLLQMRRCGRNEMSCSAKRRLDNFH